TATIPEEQLESHLRRVHRIYQFRGVRRPLHQTIATLLAAVCNPNADHEAWEALESLAQDEHGTRADSLLATGVTQALKEVELRSRPNALGAADEVIAGSSRGPGVALVLAASAEPTARHLALTVATLLPAPLSPGLAAALRPLLTAKRIPQDVQVAAAAALL